MSSENEETLISTEMTDNIDLHVFFFKFLEFTIFLS